jgi:type I restriction enzyme R subunit
MANIATELTFQNDMIRQLVTNGWLLGKPENYNRELALYEEDLLGFVKDSQDAQWQKFCALYPSNPEAALLERVAAQLNKADPNAANSEIRTAMNCATRAPASACASFNQNMTSTRPPWRASS